MSCRGLFLAITDEEVAALTATATHAGRVEYTIGQLESTYFGSDRSCETDKAWDGIHSAFDGNGLELPFDGSEPLKLVVLGGEPMHSESDHVLVLKTPEQARAAALALDGVDETAFRELYFAIDPNTYDGEIDEQEFGYHWDYLQDIKNFYRCAVAAGHSVLFSVDQ